MQQTQKRYISIGIRAGSDRGPYMKRLEAMVTNLASVNSR